MVELPTQRSVPALDAARAKVLLYGPPKIGKTTLASNLDPDRTLFICTEPGHGALSIYSVTPKDWTEFREIGAQLAQQEHPFTTVVIDTIDQLQKMCADDVLGSLGVRHASDLEYGKGWGAITDEFSLRIAKLAGLGLGVWMISHARSEEVKQRVGSITVMSPTISGGPGRFVNAFADFILFATSEQTEIGEQRLLRTVATENFQAGCRVPLPDRIPLDATLVKAAMDDACRALSPAVAA